MQNLILITSIIKIPNKPLSYTDTRSVFSSQERFEQTKNTIKTIREKIPNSKILIVECSELSDEESNYFKNNCDYFLNLINYEKIVNNIYSRSKSLGEGTMTILAIDFIKKNNIEFDNFFKISGRYWLSNNFDYNNFENEDAIVHYINDNVNGDCCTCLYKLHKSNIDEFFNYLSSNMDLMINCIGYESLFSFFLKTISNKIVHLNYIGVCGYVSVSSDFINS
jgi:hypothetical protein